jgi:hypothetical protein
MVKAATKAIDHKTLLRSEQKGVVTQYLIRYSGFFASLRLSSSGTSFSEAFANISLKRSPPDSFCATE